MNSVWYDAPSLKDLANAYDMSRSSTEVKFALGGFDGDTVVYSEPIVRSFDFFLDESVRRFLLKYKGTYRLEGDKPLIHKGKKPNKEN